VVWAGDHSGVQLVLVLDLSKAPDHDQAAAGYSQAATLLVHLLKDQDHLGLVASGEPSGVMLPATRLTREHRVQVLDELASLKPGPHPKPLTDIVAQSLEVFQPGGPEPRVLFILSDCRPETDS
jgi:uncharacterized protein (DUF58 family)